MDATAVILAPDENGDARGLAIGAGTVIDSAGHRALIVTSSHVAMPYAAVAAHRDAGEAWPVFVYLADGRSTLGRVEWTARPPLDVAVIAVDIDRPPKPVEVSATARAIDPGANVIFVPNPFRLGWMSHYGKVTKRDSHITPVGEFSLLFTDLPVQPGDSGSGLYDDSGRLIGINTWSKLEPDGPIGISLPSDTMQAILRSAGVEASSGADQ